MLYHVCYSDRAVAYIPLPLDRPSQVADLHKFAICAALGVPCAVAKRRTENQASATSHRVSSCECRADCKAGSSCRWRQCAKPMRCMHVTTRHVSIDVKRVDMDGVRCCSSHWFVSCELKTSWQARRACLRRQRLVHADLQAKVHVTGHRMPWADHLPAALEGHNQCTKAPCSAPLLASAAPPAHTAAASHL